jgi:SAM-dependent methyltransferase
MDEDMGFFDTAYLDLPPWDIGKPQPAMVELFRADEIRGSVLDVGCGTGENALFLASAGLEIWGIDRAPRAIRKARKKARERGLHVVFREFDALNLSQLGRTFDTVIDCGLFHTFTDADRPIWAESVLSVLNSGGLYFLLCFSDREPDGWGPRRVTQEEIRATFRNGWEVQKILTASFETRMPDHTGVQAWLAAIRKTADSSPRIW